MKNKIKFALVSLIIPLLIFGSCGKKKERSLYRMQVFLMSGNNQMNEQSVPLFPGETSVQFIKNVLQNTEDLEAQLQKTFGYKYFRLLDTKFFPFWKSDRKQGFFLKMEPHYYLRVYFLSNGNGSGLPVNISLFSLPGDSLSGSDNREKIMKAAHLVEKTEPLISLRADISPSQGIILGRALLCDSSRALFLVLQPAKETASDKETFQTLLDEYINLPGVFFQDYDETLNRWKELKLIEKKQERNESSSSDTGIPNLVPFKELDVKPKVIKPVNPEYPEGARKAGKEGMTVLRVLIDEYGRVLRTKLLKSSGDATLDSAAVEAARQFEFAPAQKNGKPVKVEMTIPFSFRLKK